MRRQVLLSLVIDVDAVEAASLPEVPGSPGVFGPEDAEAPITGLFDGVSRSFGLGGVVMERLRLGSPLEGCDVQLYVQDIVIGQPYDPEEDPF